MKRLSLAALAPALALTLGLSGAAKPRSIQGVWRTIEVTMPGPNGRIITSVQPNLAILTNTHYSRVEDHSDAPRPVVADLAHATAEELRAAWEPFVAEAGTYEIRGNVITMRPVVAKNPAAMVAGAYSTFAFKLAGDTIWITSKSTDRGQVADAVTVKAVRVE
jgi:hypothetical protein